MHQLCRGTTNLSKCGTMATSNKSAVNAVCITGHRTSLSQNHLAAAITPVQVEGRPSTTIRIAVSTIAMSENIGLSATVQCSSDSICTIIDLRSISDDLGTPSMFVCHLCKHETYQCSCSAHDKLIRGDNALYFGFQNIIVTQMPSASSDDYFATHVNLSNETLRVS